MIRGKVQSLSISAYLAKEVVKHFTDIATYSPPSSLYLALTNQGTELDGNGYARAPIKFGTAKSLDDGTSEVTNLEEVLFTTATGTWYADGFAIYDALTSGNCMFDGEFAETIEVTSSELLAIKEDCLRLSLGLDHWTTDAQERALNLAFAGGSYQPSGLYVALLKSEPGFDDKSSDLKELIGGGYSRAQVSDWKAIASGAESLNKTTFDTATADWDEFVASALFDDQQEGLYLGWFENIPRTLYDGDVLEIDPGEAYFGF